MAFPSAHDGRSQPDPRLASTDAWPRNCGNPTDPVTGVLDREVPAKVVGVVLFTVGDRAAYEARISGL